jgi:putative sugar O-methyltransferase
MLMCSTATDRRSSSEGQGKRPISPSNTIRTVCNVGSHPPSRIWASSQFRKRLPSTPVQGSSGEIPLMTLSDIRQFVEIAVQRRERESLAGASDAWRYGTALTSYLRQLDENELRFLRRHTLHFTGDNYQRYDHGSQADEQHITDAARYHFARLPGFRIDEGQYGIGYDTEFGRVSFDLIRYVSLLADLVESGALNRDKPSVVLEIGGGYGGCARVIAAYAPKAAVVMCDLEEMLFCSAVYLSNMCGTDSVHMVDQLDAASLIPSHFYLVPQSRLETLTGSFDLALNQQSMQEMERSQVERYCDFMTQHVDMFYSRNYPSLDSIAERLSQYHLIKDLNNFLRERFRVVWVGPKETAEFGDAWLERLLLDCRPANGDATAR